MLFCGCAELFCGCAELRGGCAELFYGCAVLFGGRAVLFGRLNGFVARVAGSGSFGGRFTPRLRMGLDICRRLRRLKTSRLDICLRL